MILDTVGEPGAHPERAGCSTHAGLPTYKQTSTAGTTGLANLREKEKPLNNSPTAAVPADEQIGRPVSG